ncbi:MAG: hypothetical protein IJU44_02715 [Kiritimatiellae bacterium]|nr:hypothetical protein [Kiritimatiellia bacterium]
MNCLVAAAVMATAAAFAGTVFNSNWSVRGKRVINIRRRRGISGQIA